MVTWHSRSCQPTRWRTRCKHIFAHVPDAYVFFCQVVSTPLILSSISDQDACRAGLKPVNLWKAYGLANYPGECLDIKQDKKVLPLWASLPHFVNFFSGWETDIICATFYIPSFVWRYWWKQPIPSLHLVISNGVFSFFSPIPVFIQGLYLSQILSCRAASATGWNKVSNSIPRNPMCVIWICTCLLKKLQIFGEQVSSSFGKLGKGKKAQQITYWLSWKTVG